MTDLATLSREDWSQLLMRLAVTVLITSVPAAIGFVLMRRGCSRLFFILGLVVTALFLAIALPSLVPARPFAQRNSCIANLKQLDGAKAQWAYEKRPEATVAPQLSDLAPFLKSGLLPTCPAGGTYTLGAVNEPTRCSHADRGHALTPPR
jgi:hypothetical protein